MLNHCEFIGRVGKDPEIKTMQNGDKLANLSLACSETWKDKATGERKERTTWVPVVVWGSLAGIVDQYVRKGSKIYVAGKFTTRKWQDQSGADRYSTEVVLQGFDAKLIMLDGKRDDGDAGGPSDGGARSGGASAGGKQSDLDDEIPF